MFDLKYEAKNRTDNEFCDLVGWYWGSWVHFGDGVDDAELFHTVMRLNLEYRD